MSIAEYTKILGDPKEVDRVIVDELKEISDKFGDDRRTVIEEHGEEIAVEDMIAEEDNVVFISHRGYAKRCPPSLYRTQGRGGKGVQGTKKLTGDDEDFVTDLFVASTHAYLLVFTTEGKLYWLKVYSLPEASRTARGRAIVNMLNLGEGERVSAIRPVRHFEPDKFVIMATKRGYIKRVDVMEFSNVRRSGIRAVSIDEGDSLIGVRITDGSRDCIISTKSGMAIRFKESDVRVMGRTARGVISVNLEEGDEVVNLVTVPHEEPREETDNMAEESARSGDVALLTVCEHGYGKRTPISAYRCQNRAGKGLIDIKANDRNGPVVGTCRVHANDEVMLITTAGKVIRTPVNSISLIGRNTMGVKLIGLDEGESVAAVARIAEGAALAEGKEDSLVEEVVEESKLIDDADGKSVH